MKKISEHLASKILNIKHKLKSKITKVYKDLAFHSEKVAILSKNKIELERARLELKKKLNTLGGYVYKKYYREQVFDFSQDKGYSNAVQEAKSSHLIVNKIIAERKKIKKT